MHADMPAAGRTYPSQNPHDEGMVDIDLEGGKSEKFGSPRMSDSEMRRQREEEKLAIAGLEQRRPATPLIGSRASSPLSRGSSVEITPTSRHFPDQTPRASGRDEVGIVPQSVVAATTALRRPPPIANHGNPVRTRTSDEERDRGFHRVTLTGTGGSERPRAERESSVVSIGSEQGLLDGKSGRNSPALGSPVGSPFSMNYGAQGKVPVVRIADLEDAMEEISLEAGK